MKISREDVLRVAELAYLDLTEAELETYRAQVDDILEYIGKLNELDTANVEPMAQVLTDDQTADATLREDLVVPCAVAEEILVQAPDPEGAIQRWAVEWAAAGQLTGISRDTLKPGDHVIITGNPGRTTEDHRIRMRSILRPKDGFKWSGDFQ